MERSCPRRPRRAETEGRTAWISTKPRRRLLKVVPEFASDNLLDVVTRRSGDLTIHSQVFAFHRSLISGGNVTYGRPLRKIGCMSTHTNLVCDIFAASRQQR